MLDTPVHTRSAGGRPVANRTASSATIPGSGILATTIVGSDAGLGNITGRSFQDIWGEFRSHCGHPVRECVVHRLAAELAAAPSLPLPPEKTYELWPEVCRIEATDVYRRLKDV